MVDIHSAHARDVLRQGSVRLGAESVAPASQRPARRRAQLKQYVISLIILSWPPQTCKG